jgi:hypothetical protein
MDIRLSGQRDGVDAAIDLFSLHGVRCVFATAHHAADTRLRAKPANPLAWVAKPYTMQALITVVRKVVQDVRAGNEHIIGWKRYSGSRQIAYPRPPDFGSARAGVLGTGFG